MSVTDAQECKNIYKERGGILGEKQICAGGQKGKVRVKAVPAIMSFSLAAVSF